jgi:hypothetical protein
MKDLQCVVSSMRRFMVMEVMIKHPPMVQVTANQMVFLTVLLLATMTVNFVETTVSEDGMLT